MDDPWVGLENHFQGHGRMTHLTDLRITWDHISKEITQLGIDS